MRRAGSRQRPLEVYGCCVGKRVEIVVREESLAVTSGTGDWAAALQAARELEDYDFDAWRAQRDHDQKHAHEHQP